TGVTEQGLTFSIHAGDVSPADQGSLALTVDWGDGSPIESESVPTAAHQYASAGTYLVTLSVGDKDGGHATATSTVTISPFLVNGTNLLIGGTAGSDAFLIKPVTGGYRVLVNNVSLGTFSPSVIQV